MWVLVKIWDTKQAWALELRVISQGKRWVPGEAPTIIVYRLSRRNCVITYVYMGFLIYTIVSLSHNKFFVRLHRLLLPNPPKNSAPRLALEQDSCVHAYHDSHSSHATRVRRVP